MLQQMNVKVSPLPIHHEEPCSTMSNSEYRLMFSAANIVSKMGSKLCQKQVSQTTFISICSADSWVGLMGSVYCTMTLPAMPAPWWGSQ